MAARHRESSGGRDKCLSRCSPRFFGMKKTDGTAINLAFIQTEKDIFTLLNLKYINPENRVDERNIIQTK